MGSRWRAVETAAGIAVAAASAIAIQLWFRAQAKRSHFRRRQTRVASFTEAFSSIIWAATAVLAAAGSWLALMPAGFALLVLAGARMIAPRAA